MRSPSGGDISLPSSTPETVALVLVYFVLGYAFYGCAFAAAAALVSRQEDSQSTTTPLLVILIGSYIATNSRSAAPKAASHDRHLPAADGADGGPGRAAQGELPAGNWRRRWR